MSNDIPSASRGSPFGRVRIPNLNIEISNAEALRFEAHPNAYSTSVDGGLVALSPVKISEVDFVRASEICDRRAYFQTCGDIDGAETVDGERPSASQNMLSMGTRLEGVVAENAMRIVRERGLGVLVRNDHPQMSFFSPAFKMPHSNGKSHIAMIGHPDAVLTAHNHLAIVEFKTMGSRRFKALDFNRPSTYAEALRQMQRYAALAALTYTSGHGFQPTLSHGYLAALNRDDGDFKFGRVSLIVDPPPVESIGMRWMRALTYIDGEIRSCAPMALRPVWFSKRREPCGSCRFNPLCYGAESTESPAGNAERDAELIAEYREGRELKELGEGMVASAKERIGAVMDDMEVSEVSFGDDFHVERVMRSRPSRIDRKRLKTDGIIDDYTIPGNGKYPVLMVKDERGK